MRRDKSDEQHPRAIIVCMVAKPRDRLVPHSSVVGIVFRMACAHLVETYNIVPGGRDRIAHRPPHLPDPLPDVHRPVLGIEAGWVLGLAIVKLADGLYAHIRRLQSSAPAGDTAVIRRRVVPVADFVNVAARREARAGGNTDWTGRVGRIEPAAAFGKRVDMRRPDDWMIGARQRTRLVFVRDDEKKV